jgi:hypothetical protein
MEDELVRELLVRIGVLSEADAAEVARAQTEGDSRSFGRIAIELGYVHDDTIIDYLALARSA